MTDDIAVLETNLEPRDAESHSLQDEFMDAGERGVSILPAMMKKFRPGDLVKIICKPRHRQRVARALTEKTGH
ncbi:nickel insertion protein [Halopiger xanaduensis]|uniref:nickel insertion protein n=1 Tax=Halopiger xanaduensis TaxID=387343 RepID=UPI00373FDF16